MRCYETYGADTELQLEFFKDIKDLQEISLTEDEVYQELDKMGKKIDLDIGKWEIKTLQWEKG